MKAGADASPNKDAYVTLAELLARAVFRAVNMSSLTLPEVGVKTVVIGLVVLSLVNEGSAVLKFARAVFTFVGVMADSVAGEELKLANQVLGVAELTRLATSRSVRGLIFTVPAAVAMEV